MAVRHPTAVADRARAAHLAHRQNFPVFCGETETTVVMLPGPAAVVRHFAAFD